MDQAVSMPQRAMIYSVTSLIHGLPCQLPSCKASTPPVTSRALPLVTAVMRVHSTLHHTTVSAHPSATAVAVLGCLVGNCRVVRHTVVLAGYSGQGLHTNQPTSQPPSSAGTIIVPCALQEINDLKNNHEEQLMSLLEANRVQDTQAEATRMALEAEIAQLQEQLAATRNRQSSSVEVTSSFNANASATDAASASPRLKKKKKKKRLSEPLPQQQPLPASQGQGATGVAGASQAAAASPTAGERTFADIIAVAPFFDLMWLRKPCPPAALSATPPPAFASPIDVADTIARAAHEKCVDKADVVANVHQLVLRYELDLCALWHDYGALHTQQVEALKADHAQALRALEKEYKHRASAAVVAAKAEEATRARSPSGERPLMDINLMEKVAWLQTQLEKGASVRERELQHQVDVLRGHIDANAQDEAELKGGSTGGQSGGAGLAKAPQEEHREDPAEERREAEEHQDSAVEAEMEASAGPRPPPQRRESLDANPRKRSNPVPEPDMDDSLRVGHGPCFESTGFCSTRDSPPTAFPTDNVIPATDPILDVGSAPQAQLRLNAPPNAVPMDSLEGKPHSNTSTDPGALSSGDHPSARVPGDDAESLNNSLLLGRDSGRKVVKGEGEGEDPPVSGRRALKRKKKAKARGTEQKLEAQLQAALQECTSLKAQLKAHQTQPQAHAVAENSFGAPLRFNKTTHPPLSVRLGLAPALESVDGGVDATFRPGQTLLGTVRPRQRAQKPEAKAENLAKAIQDMCENGDDFVSNIYKVVLTYESETEVFVVQGPRRIGNAITCAGAPGAMLVLMPMPMPMRMLMLLMLRR